HALPFIPVEWDVANFLTVVVATPCGFSPQAEGSGLNLLVTD
ncbi:MAG: hypothetical protein RJB54_473, partial [Actinomycetota bacterium]